MTYLNYKKKIEFGINEFNLIDSHCKKRKINWFASAWDIDSVKFLNKYNLKYNKIASAMLTNFNLLKAVAKQRKLTFISFISIYQLGGFSSPGPALQCMSRPNKIGQKERTSSQSSEMR